MRVAVCSIAGEMRVGLVSSDGQSISPFQLSVEDAKKGILALLGREGDLPPTSSPVPLIRVTLEAPIPRPLRNIFCVGKNYHDHAHEFASSGYDSSAAKGAVPKDPIIFSKVPESVIAHGQDIVSDPAISSSIDYEAELAVIIGRQGRGIKRDRVMDHIWGYTIINDVTARDLQGRYSQWLIGKSQDTFCPMGPFAVTRDEIDILDTDVSCYVNGELRQKANTRDLIFDVPTIIETISAGITLRPGDIVATGTPAGVGIGFKPPKFLKNGDVVRIEIAGIGTLENRFVEHAS